MYAAVRTTQDIVYVMNALLPIGLFVELPMIPEVNDIGAIHLANNWSVSVWPSI